MRLITVEPAMFGFVLVVVMLSPLLQQYIYRELSNRHNLTTAEDTELCENATSVGENITSLENLVQTETSHWLIGLSLSSSLPSVFTTLMYGSMSDSIGRKPILLLCVCGSFIRCLIVALTVTFYWPFYVIFLGAFVDGVTGSFGTLTGACLAYIVDITDNQSRSIRVGVLEIILVFSAMVSFLVTGIWLRNSGYVPPLWASAVLMFVICLYVAFFLPESLKEKQSFNTFSCLTNAKRIKDFVLAKKGPYINVCLALLLISFLFSVFDYFGSITVLFTKHHPLCWGPEMIGYYMATKTAVAGLGIIVTFKFLTKFLAETLIVIIGCICYMLSNIIVGFAKNTSAMFISCIPAFLAVSAPPCIRSIATKMVEKHHEGALCSVIAVTETIAQLLSPTVFNTLYPVGLNELHLPGFAFFVEAGLLVIPAVLFSIIHYLTQKNGDIMYGKMAEIIDDQDTYKVST